MRDRLWAMLMSAALAVTPLGLHAGAKTAAGTSVHQRSEGAGTTVWDRLDRSRLQLRSESALVVDRQGRVVYAKNPERVTPIASITKPMTAMVVLDSGAPLDRPITITAGDGDKLRRTGSRLAAGNATLDRGEMLLIALMSSENRAAAALGRTTLPGGTDAFVRAMNRKAAALGMRDTRFADPTGLDAGNVSTARDLVRMVRAAGAYPLIRRATTTEAAQVKPYRKRGELRYVNTNRLLKNESWEIGLSKTGYINEAGRCLVMEAQLGKHTLNIVLLNSSGKLTPFGDSNRVRKWLASELREDL